MSWFRYFPSIGRTIFIIISTNNNNNNDHNKDNLLKNKTITVMREGCIPRRLLCLHCCLNIYALSWEVLRLVGSVFDKVFYFKNWMFDISGHVTYSRLVMWCCFKTRSQKQDEYALTQIKREVTCADQHLTQKRLCTLICIAGDQVELIIIEASRYKGTWSSAGSLHILILFNFTVFA